MKKSLFILVGLGVILSGCADLGSESSQNIEPNSELEQGDKSSNDVEQKTEIVIDYKKKEYYDGLNRIDIRLATCKSGGRCSSESIEGYINERIELVKEWSEKGVEFDLEEYIYFSENDTPVIHWSKEELPVLEVYTTLEEYYDESYIAPTATLYKNKMKWQDNMYVLIGSDFDKDVNISYGLYNDGTCKEVEGTYTSQGIKVTDCSYSSSKEKISITVENNSDFDLSYLQVEIYGIDSNGKTVSSDYTNHGSIIRKGASQTLEAYVDKYTSYEVEISKATTK